jgi:hypothetical protein
MFALAKAALQTAIERLALPGIMIGHRFISPGDECALMPEEALGFTSSVAKVRPASGGRPHRGGGTSVPGWIWNMRSA